MNRYKFIKYIVTVFRVTNESNIIAFQATKLLLIKGFYRSRVPVYCKTIILLDKLGEG